MKNKKNKRYIWLIIILIILIILCLVTYIWINFQDIRFKYFINENNAKILIEERLSKKYNENIKIITMNISKEYINYFDSEDESLIFEGKAYNTKYKDKIFDYKVTQGFLYVEDNYKVHLYSDDVENKLKSELNLLNKNFINSYTYNIEYLSDATNVTSLELFMIRNILSIDILIDINNEANFNEFYNVIYLTCNNIFDSFSNNMTIRIKTRNNNESLKDVYCLDIFVNKNSLENLNKVSNCFN